jgi:hypothetical protein
MGEDVRGNPVGTASAQALAHAEKALWRMVSFFDTPLADLDAAAAADPSWAWPHLMRAGFLLSLTEPSLLHDVDKSLDEARLRMRGAAGGREQAHLAALSRGAQGRWPEACAAWDAMLEAHPRDLAALQWAHLFDFYCGDAGGLRDRPRRALSHWTSDDPLRPYVLGMLAFGLEECHAYAEAEAVGREAVAGPAKVPWATHAVAHVMEMQGRTDDGIAWLESRRADWSEGNGFAGHHWWHLALFHLERLDTAAVLALHDAHLSSANNALTLQRLDGAALLWRLRLLDVDVGNRWHDIAHGWDFDLGSVGHSAFNDVHALLVMLGRGRRAEADEWVATAEQRAGASTTSNGTMARQVGVPLMRGLLAFERGAFADAVRWIEPVRQRAQRLGGSHAQRDLLTQTLIAAALRAGQPDLVRALVDERGKPHTPLAEHWRQACRHSTN